MCEAVSNNQNKNDEFCEICGQGTRRCPRCGREIPTPYISCTPYIPYNPWPGWQTPYRLNLWYYTWPWVAYYNIPTWTGGTT